MVEFIFFICYSILHSMCNISLKLFNGDKTMINSNDRRVKRTQKAIKDAMITLLKKKEINKITIKEITDLADIDRRTFYLHYEDIYDLMQKMQDEVISAFEEQLLNNENDEIPDDKPFYLITTAFDFFCDNAEISEIFLRENSNYNFAKRIDEIIKERCFALWEKLYPNCPKSKMEIVYAYTLCGTIGVFVIWQRGLTNKSREDIIISTDRIARLSCNLLNSD